MLVTCYECDAKISHTVATCPRCGFVGNSRSCMVPHAGLDSVEIAGIFAAAQETAKANGTIEFSPDKQNFWMIIEVRIECPKCGKEKLSVRREIRYAERDSNWKKIKEKYSSGYVTCYSCAVTFSFENDGDQVDVS